MKMQTGHLFARWRTLLYTVPRKPALYLKILAFPLIAFFAVKSVSAPLKTILYPFAISALLVVIIFPALLNRAARILTERIIFILSLVVITTAMLLGQLFFYNFSNYDFGDIACYLSSFYNLQHAIPGINAVWGKPLLSMHSEFTSIPLAWLFSLFPDPSFLLILQFLMVLAAWLLFRKWVYRVIKDPLTTGLLVFASALSPWILSLLLRGYHGISTGLFLYVLVAIAFIEKQWRIFIFAVPALLLVKEICVVTVFSIGILAVLCKYEKKWYIYPICLSVLYGIFLKFFYFPAVLNGESYYYSSYLNLPDPLIFAKTLGSYLAMLFLFSGSPSVFSSKISLMIIPPAIVNSFLGNQFVSPQFHYIIEPAFWATMANVHGISQADEPVDSKRLKAVSTVVTMLILSAFLITGLPGYYRHNYQNSYLQGVNLVLPGETVTLGAPVAGHLWKAARLSWVIYNDINKKADKIILQKTDSPFWCLPSEFERVKKCIAETGNDSSYTTIWEDSVLVVFSKKKDTEPVRME